MHDGGGRIVDCCYVRPARLLQPLLHANAFEQSHASAIESHAASLTEPTRKPIHDVPGRFEASVFGSGDAPPPDGRSSWRPERTRRVRPCRSYTASGQVRGTNGRVRRQSERRRGASHLEVLRRDGVAVEDLLVPGLKYSSHSCGCRGEGVLGVALKRPSPEPLVNTLAPMCGLRREFS